MIDKTINSIIEAEAQAELQEREAIDKARKIVKEATDLADKMKADTEKEVKQQVRAKKAEWEAIGEKKASSIIKEAEAKAESLYSESESKIDELSQYVAQTIIDKYKV